MKNQLDKIMKYVEHRYLSVTLSVLMVCLMGSFAKAQTLGSLHYTSASQNELIVKKGTDLEQAIKNVKQKFNIVFLYRTDIIKNKKVHETKFLPNNIEKALKELLEDQGLLFKTINSQTYGIYSKEDPSPNKEAAAEQISGQVTDAKTGETLPGVNIIVKGTTTGVSSDANGNYELTVQSLQDTLVVSFVGYATKNVPINGRTTLNIALSLQAVSGEEMVVIGYGSEKKENISGSISSVGNDEISKQQVSSLGEALEGQIAGVSATLPSGRPGAANNIRIRGVSSINSGNGPLYVIDGVPTVPSYTQEISTSNQQINPLASINPDDIESMTVLKGGAAAAIYGVRASNGVIVIETKKGQAGESNIEFNASQSFQRITKELDVLNGPQFARLYNDQLTNAGDQPYFSNPDQVKTSTNWQDKIYRIAPEQKYHLSFSGGTDKLQYYVAGGYNNQEGIVINSGFKRYSAKINLNYQMSDKFSFGTNLNLARTNTNTSPNSGLGLNRGGAIIGALVQIPTIPVRNNDGSYASNPLRNLLNPVGSIVESNTQILLSKVTGNIHGQYDILPNLSLKSNLGVDFRGQNENQYITRENPTFESAAVNNRGSGATGTENYTSWLWENSITYDKPIFNNSNMKLLGGFSIQSYSDLTSSANVRAFPTNAVPYLFAATTINGVSTYKSEHSLESFFARGIFNFDERYSATVSLRADGTSRLKGSNQFGFFPAASVAWRISNESFFPQQSVVSSLKLRLSAAQNGNQEIGNYGTYSTYGTGINYPGAAGEVQGGIRPQTLGNPDLHWEATTQYNLGLDAGIFNDRLSVTFDAYYKKTTDLLQDVQLPPHIAYGSITKNIGEITNKGLELSITSTNIQSDFIWTTTLNASMNRNNVDFLGKVTDAEDNLVNRRIIAGYNTAANSAHLYTITAVGQPLGAFYGYVAKGIFKDAAEVQDAPTQPNAAPGDVRFADLNGDGKISPDDQTIIGNPYPDYTGGITNNFFYKNFELSVLFSGSFGNDIYNRTAASTMGMFQGNNATTKVLDRWTTNNRDTNVPRAVQGDPNRNRRASTRFVESGTYIRLKNLSLSYNFSSEALSGLGVKGLGIYARGRNLLTFTDYSGFDPDVSSNGRGAVGYGEDFGAYPKARIYTLGVNLKF